VIILSLFDGISCGRMALEQSEIYVEKYYTSEIDKYATQVSDAIYPDNIKLGDITKWREWGIDWCSIDMILGGFPCQSFSFSGKQLNFDDPRGQLFFVMIEILNHVKLHNPQVKFLFENVRMKKEFSNIINKMIGVDPVLINSSLVSAQNRQRNYWASWNIDQPEDRYIYLKDVLDPELKTCRVGAAVRGRRLNENGQRQDYSDIPISQYLEIRKDSKSNCLTTVQKDNVISYIKTDKMLKIKFNQSKSSCLTGGAHSGGNHSDMDILVIDPGICRRYSVRECARLQTIPEYIIDIMLGCGVSNSQLYKMIGNGWTIEVIKHIYIKGIKLK